jgi:hypothetical protein
LPLTKCCYCFYRIQLRKLRERERVEEIKRLELIASITIKNFIDHYNRWKVTLAKLDKIKRQFFRDRMIRRLRRGGHLAAAVVRFNAFMRERKELEKRQDRQSIEQQALRVIAFYLRRHREIGILYTRFQMRQRVLKALHELEAEKLAAEASRQEALEEVRRSDENMKATIAASWKQGSDTTGRNYYYNYVTGESRWTPPDDWQVKPADEWVRNTDERGNLYYYNVKTNKSRWLPPCTTCGKQAEKWCMDCGMSFCDKHYDSLHSDEALSQHTWSLTEIERDVLGAGEAYCIECRKRRAVDMCTSCWDPFCADCFKHVHKSGNLRNHKTIDYRRAKKGWICVKAREESETDYYINGSTGETTYEKPIQLMTEQERVYFQNFQSHKKVADEYVLQIGQLQQDLEAASYERDRILLDSLNKEGDKRSDVTVKGMTSVQGGSTVSVFSGGDKSAYRKYLLQPSGRRRGKERSDYIKGLLERVVEANITSN